MKQTSNAGLIVGAVAAAGAVLLGGAFLAGAMARTPADLAATPATGISGPSPRGESGSEPSAAEGDASSAPRPGADAPVETPITAASGALSPQLLVLAAERAPFHPERQAPSGRYLFPEERVVEGPPPEPPAPPEPPFRVVGAVSAGSQSIAVVEAQGQAPKVLRVGEDLMGFRVKSVEGDVVVVSGQGWDLTLPVEALQPVRIGANTRGNRRTTEVQRGNERNQRDDQERAIERAQEAVRERMEALQRQLEGRGGGEVRMEMQGDRAIIVGPNGLRREIQIPGGEGQRERIIVAPGQRIQVRPGGGGR